MTGLGVWQWVGLLLGLWAGYDLLAGYTYTYRKILRSQEPLLYWCVLGLWIVLALSCWFWA